MVLAERGVAATLAAAGAKKVTMPDWHDHEERLNAALGLVEDTVDPADRDLRQSLGLR